MKIEPVDGTYSPQEALKLVSRLIDGKIGLPGDKIETTLGQEDIKMIERRIRSIQGEFHRVRLQLTYLGRPCSVVSSM